MVKILRRSALADFLHRRRVPDFTSPACSCGWYRQTAKHVVMYCRLLDGRDGMLRDCGHEKLSISHRVPPPSTEISHSQAYEVGAHWIRSYWVYSCVISSSAACYLILFLFLTGLKVLARSPVNAIQERDPSGYSAACPGSEI